MKIVIIYREEDSEDDLIAAANKFMYRGESLQLCLLTWKEIDQVFSVWRFDKVMAAPWTSDKLSEILD